MPQDLSCPSAEVLRLVLAGALPGPEGEWIAAHLETCLHCSQLAARLDAVDSATDDLRAVATRSEEELAAASLVDHLKGLWVEPDGTANPVEHFTSVDLSPAQRPDELGRLGHYRILRHLGSGGMGMVFAANDPKLDRAVAIKVLSRSDPLMADLMHRERTLLAALRHPHIVTVYDSGELADGRPYLVMEFVEGDTLDRYVETQKPRPRRLVEVIRDVAAAVGAAHVLGIIHRDLKPENIKVTSTGEARVLDFGLAKRFAETSISATSVGAAALGATGILGTRGYMSPEQAHGERVDARTDVFALGKTLDQFLPAGQHRDLAAVLAKCTAPSPALRYPDATALAADLDNWLAHRPVAARSAPAWERAWQWARRKPTAAALVAMSVLALVALPVAVIGGIYNARLALSLADTQKARERAEDAERRIREAAYFHRIMLAGQEWRDAQLGRARELLAECDPEYRGWEWHYLSRVCDPPTLRFNHPTEVYAVAVSPDGALIASGCDDNVARIWDAKTGALRHTLRGHTKRVYGLGFDPDGRRLVTAGSDGMVKIWDATDGRERFTFTGHTGSVRAAVFSPDGQWVASAAKDGRVKVWSPTTGVVRLDLAGLDGQDHSLAFGLDGRWLAYAGKKSIRIWDTDSGELVHNLEGHAGFVRGLAFHPAGTHLASVGEDAVGMVWELGPGVNSKPRVLRGHTAKVYAVAWSPDGLSLATAGMDSAIKVWEPATGMELSHLQGHTGRVYAVAWCPDSRRLVSASTDHLVRLWDVQALTGFRRLRAGGIVRAVAWSPDGGRVYAASERPDHLECWDTATGRRRFSTPLSWRGTIALDVSPDGRLLATAGAGQPVALWDAETGMQRALFDAPTATVQVIAFSPDGTRLVAAARDRTVQFWDLAARRASARFDANGPEAEGGWAIGDRSVVRLVRSIPADAQVNKGLAWRPDGRRIACGSLESRITVWDADTGQVSAVLRGHTHGVNSLSWSPNGRRLASASADRTIRIWDPSAGQQTLALRGFAKEVLAVTWSPDGRYLTAGSTDGTILIWDGSPAVP